jgi:hypothetical protein
MPNKPLQELHEHPNPRGKEMLNCDILIGMSRVIGRRMRGAISQGGERTGVAELADVSAAGPADTHRLAACDKAPVDRSGVVREGGEAACFEDGGGVRRRAGEMDPVPMLHIRLHVRYDVGAAEEASDGVQARACSCINVRRGRLTGRARSEDDGAFERPVENAVTASLAWRPGRFPQSAGLSFRRLSSMEVERWE